MQPHCDLRTRAAQVIGHRASMFRALSPVTDSRILGAIDDLIRDAQQQLQRRAVADQMDH
jgi:hypothetical protein